MYLPKRFNNDDIEKSLQLIRNFPLATLISVGTNQTPYISHLPLVIESDANRNSFTLFGHLARANPHLQLLNQQKVYAIFHGPQAYITPRWYAENDVPTWNYAVVHAQGPCQLIEDVPGILNCLKKLTQQIEGQKPSGWEFWLPEDLQPGTLEKHIAGFQIQVETLQAKFKMSQNRSEADRQGVIQGLSQLEDDRSKEVLELMQALAVPSHNI